MVLHTVGRTGEYKLHHHVLLMAGGINHATGRWEVLDKFPYQILHKSWKKCLLNMLREFDQDGKYKKVFDFIEKKYPKGFVARIEKGNLPKDSKHLVRYISKYLCLPQISQKRIKRYNTDCGEVEFRYKSHKTKRMETEVLSSMNFLGRLVQQILPKSFQRIRYFGLQASKNMDRLKCHVAKAVGTLYSNVTKINGLHTVIQFKPNNGLHSYLKIEHVDKEDPKKTKVITTYTQTMDNESTFSHHLLPSYDAFGSFYQYGAKYYADAHNYVKYEENIINGSKGCQKAVVWNNRKMANEFLSGSNCKN